MATLTKALIDRHVSLGGFVLALSATLGETAVAVIQSRKPRSYADAVVAPYPAIRTSATDHRLETDSSRTVSIRLREKGDLIALVADRVRAGEAVLWIRSTVKDALADVQMFETLNVACLLHHSRYALEDRNWLDRQLLRHLWT
jgi:CRISPR-associated endonuclease/helicase Cas3